MIHLRLPGRARGVDLRHRRAVLSYNRGAMNTKLVMTGATLAVLPPLVLFVFLQRFFVDSIVVKGRGGCSGLRGTAITKKRGEAVENVDLPDLAAFEQQDHPIASRQGRTACAQGHAGIHPVEEGEAFETEPVDGDARCVATGDAERADRMAVEDGGGERGKAVGQFAASQAVVLFG